MEKRPVGYQLYSARWDAEKDLLSVLRQLKAMGYDGVEFAGFYGHTAEEITAMLQETGLAAVSSHVPFDDIRRDAEGVIAFHKAIGARYIAVPYLANEDRPGTPGFSRTIRDVRAFGEMCRAAGIQLLYHNHDFEFVPVSGQYGLDFLYDAIEADVLATELDVCWVKYAGVDPAAYIRQYAGRCPVIHLKDYVGVKDGDKNPYALLGDAQSEKEQGAVSFEFRPVGHGCQDVEEVVEAGIASGAAWFIVEQDDPVCRTALEAAQMSIDTVKKIGLK